MHNRVAACALRMSEAIWRRADRTDTAALWQVCERFSPMPLEAVVIPSDALQLGHNWPPG